MSPNQRNWYFILFPTLTCQLQIKRIHAKPHISLVIVTPNHRFIRNNPNTLKNTAILPRLKPHLLSKTRQVDLAVHTIVELDPNLEPVKHLDGYRCQLHADSQLLLQPNSSTHTYSILETRYMGTVGLSTRIHPLPHIPQSRPHQKPRPRLPLTLNRLIHDRQNPLWQRGIQKYPDSTRHKTSHIIIATKAGASADGTSTQRGSAPKLQFHYHHLPKNNTRAR